MVKVEVIVKGLKSSPAPREFGYTTTPASGGKGGACPIRSPGKKSGNVKRANIEIPPFITIKKTKFTLSKVKTSGTSAVAKASGGLKPAFAKASDDDAELEKEFKNTQTVFAKHPDVVPQAIAFDLDETTTPCPAGGARKWLIIDQAKGKLLQDTAKYMAAKPEAQADLKDAAAKLMMAKAKEIAKDGLKHPDLNGKNIDDQITKVTGIIDWADAAKGSASFRLILFLLKLTIISFDPVYCIGGDQGYGQIQVHHLTRGRYQPITMPG
ncbi:hypothetical protein FPV67DRAFT_1453344 [Lyophyllum atratum]|nr:hypothetical protein FPV67DRAFT_1453344 [Lyophyllum atratum]